VQNVERLPYRCLGNIDPDRQQQMQAEKTRIYKNEKEGSNCNKKSSIYKKVLNAPEKTNGIYVIQGKGNLRRGTAEGGNVWSSCGSAVDEREVGPGKNHPNGGANPQAE